MARVAVFHGQILAMDISTAVMPIVVFDYFMYVFQIKINNFIIISILTIILFYPFTQSDLTT